MMFFGSSARLIGAHHLDRAGAGLVDQEAHACAGRCRARRCRCLPARSARCTSCWFSRSAVSRSAASSGRSGRRGGSCRRPHGRRCSTAGRRRRLRRTESSMQLGQARDRHAGVGGHGAAAGLASACRRSRRGGAPSTAGCAPRAWWPIRSLRRRARAAMSCTVCGLLLHAGRAAVELHQQHRRLAQRSACRAALTARTAFASSSSQRAIGTPIWMIWMVVVHRRGDAREVADRRRSPPRAAGRACSVISVITPSVPSLPTNSRVRS